MRSWRILSLSLPLVLILTAWAGGQDFAWIEGEAPTEANMEIHTHGWGNPRYMSEGGWGHVGDADKKSIPEAGVKLAYDFTLSSGGEHEVWARLGYYRLWYPFEWRIDGGKWRKPTEETWPVQCSMPIQRFNKLIWMRLNVQDLSAGKHTLHIRMPNPKDLEGKKKPRFLWAADAFCIYKGQWLPNGKFKPGSKWRTERDVAAEKHVFQLPEAPGDGSRVELPMAGVWQIARYDEPGPVEDRLGPIASAPQPESLYWSSIEVPGDRNKLRPDLVDAHRFFYRTRVFVPESHAGRSFVLDVPMVSMIGTVFVNGKRCGYTRAPYTRWKSDLTEAIEPGKVNEIWVGIKDCAYGFSPKLNPGGTCREWWWRPFRTNAGYMTKTLDMPVALMWHAGLLDRPLLVSAGAVRTEDVYVRTSVARKRIDVEVTVSNPTDRAGEVEVTNEIVPAGGGEVAKRLAARRLTVPAGKSGSFELSEPWADAKLWWPDEPHLYHLVTTIKHDGDVVDRKSTRFGFREWDWSTERFKLNGIPWKLTQNHGYHEGTPAKSLEAMRADHVNMLRWRVGLGDLVNRDGLNYRQWLDWCDESGIIVRTTAPFDGMFVNYNLRPDQNRDLWDNYIHLIDQWVRGLRNRPSIMIWSLQNEIVLINGRNVKTYGPLMDEAAAAAQAADPSRPVMNDGAGATGEKIPVNGLHYFATSEVSHYPDDAYSWKWSRQETSRRWVNPIAGKPTFLGESYYTGGKKLGWFASIGGEACFRGIAHCERARGLMAKMLTEGFRWQGVAAWDFLTGPSFHNNSFSPVAVFCRQWDWTHGSGDTVARTLKVFNDTRFGDPITARWSLNFDGRTVDGGSRRFNLAPGSAERFEISLDMPETDKRIRGELVLTCHRGGKEVFREVKPVAVIDPDAAELPEVDAGEIAVMDPSGAVPKRLKSRQVAYVEIDSPKNMPAGARLLIVGPDAVGEQLARDGVWRELAMKGKRVLVLDQANPLLGPAVEGDFKTSDEDGRIAFIENAIHPIFAGLEDADLFCRAGDHVVYRKAYHKPNEGARSLIQCDYGLGYSALLETRIGDGLMLLSQAVAGSKLGSDPVAQRLFDNMIAYALDYKRIVNPVIAVAPEGHPKLAVLENIRLSFTRMDDPVAAIRSGLGKIVIVDAIAPNLQKLAANLDEVRAFTESGGWLMLWGVEPRGLASFNKLVGVDHVMRPWRQERTNLRRPLDPLAVGMSERDVAMTTGKRYMRFTNTEIPSPNSFTYAVDYDDIAPFCTFPPATYFKHMEDDPVNNGHSPLNMVNGMTSRDGWRFIFYIHLFDNPPTQWDIKLPRRETVTGLGIVPNGSYHHLRQLKLNFDGAEPVTLDLEPFEKPSLQTFDFQPRKAQTVHVDLTDWGGSQRQDVLGIDELSLIVKRGDEFYDKVHPLAEDGVLNRYPNGDGGIVLNQVKLMDNEPNPANASKKRSIVRTLLANLDAAFGEQQVAGGEMTSYKTLVPLIEANLFLSRSKNWPDDKHDLSKLPTGKTRLGSVPYEIFDNPLAPGEADVLGLGSAGDFKGVDEGKVRLQAKADALFLAHTFIRERAFAHRGGRKAPVVMHYVVTYADGGSEKIPVRLGEQIDHWLQRTAADLDKAKVAWHTKLDDSNQAVVYHMTWANPHPEKKIDTVRMRITPAGEKHGCVAVIALTAGTK